MHPLQTILNRIKEHDYMDFSIRSYSGRFMYGKECLAIDGDDINLIQLGMYIKEYDRNNEIYPEELNKVRQDSMGLGIVVYFPDIPYHEDEHEEDGELIHDEP